MLNPTPLPRPAQPPGEPPRVSSPGAVRAVDLLGERRVLLIEHAGERYQLRLTRNDKLILTK